MTMRIRIKGADFSGLGLPKFHKLRYGFPVESLSALYLLEDGTLDASVSTALDYSGNGRDAPLITGSAAIAKKSYGVGTVDDDVGRGFLFKTPVTMGASSFSVVTAHRYKGALGANHFPVVHQASTAMSSEDLANSNGGAPVAMTLDCAASGAAIGHQLYGPAQFNGSGYTKSFSVPAADRFQWACAAWSFDKDTGKFIYRSGGSGGETIDLTHVGAAVIASTGKHCFGMAAFIALNDCDGDLGLAALYSSAKDAADLDALIDAAKARMLLRGVVCV
jgi:hypothetical protein